MGMLLAFFSSLSAPVFFCIYVYMYIFVRVVLKSSVFFYNKTHNHTVVSFSENKTKNIDFLFFFLLKWKRS